MIYILNESTYSVVISTSCCTGIQAIGKLIYLFFLLEPLSRLNGIQNFPIWSDWLIGALPRYSYLLLPPTPLSIAVSFFTQFPFSFVKFYKAEVIIHILLTGYCTLFGRLFLFWYISSRPSAVSDFTYRKTWGLLTTGKVCWNLYR